jgi:hypothetical protein
MSKALDNADLIRTRLLTAPAAGELATRIDITGVDVIVDRQKNILNKVAAAVGKSKGTAIVILWGGFVTSDENASKPRLESRYTISVWSKPVIAQGDLAADDVMEAVIRRIWHWRPGGPHAHGEARVKDGGIVPNASYLIYDCEVVIPSTH